MFESRRKTVIAKGLKIEGRVTAEGLVEVNGQIDGELHGRSLIISRGAYVKGVVSVDRVVVDGTIEGPIKGGEVILKSQAHVIGDIHHQSLSIENGASFEGRSVGTGRVKGDVTKRGVSTNRQGAIATEACPAADAPRVAHVRPSLKAAHGPDDAHLPRGLDLGPWLKVRPPTPNLILVRRGWYEPLGRRRQRRSPFERARMAFPRPRISGTVAPGGSTMRTWWTW